MKKLCQILNEVDLFGCDIKWRIGGDQKFTTKFGSFIYISLLLYYFIHSIYLFKR